MGLLRNLSLKLAEIIELIISKSGKSKDEVIKLIEAKKNELEGWLTDEGAASLVARELNLDLYETQAAPELKLSVRDLVAGMTGVSLNLKVLRIFAVHTFQRKQGGEGKVGSVLAADDTGKIRVTFWGNHTQPIEDREFDEGDIVRVINGRIKTGLREQLELHLGTGSRIMVNPPDIDLDAFPEIKFDFTPLGSLEDGMNDINVNGIVVSKFRKSTFSRGDSEGVVASLSIQDSTGQTRLVLWDEQADWFEKLEIQDQVRIIGAYVRLDRNNVPELHVGRRAVLQRLDAPDGTISPPDPSKPVQLNSLKLGAFVPLIELVVVDNQGMSTFSRKDGSEGKRLVLILADATGQVRAVAWNRSAEELSEVGKGDHLRLEGAACRSGLRQDLELHINESTKALRNPPGLKISSPSTQPILTSEGVRGQRQLSDLQEGQTVTVQGTIVQVIHQKSVYDACPQCSRKVSIEGDVISCSKCGKVDHAEPRLIAKIVIDDGTENRRVSFIGASAEKLLGITGQKAKALIDESGDELEPVRLVEDQLLGKEVVISGRIRMNTFSNELEVSVTQLETANPLEVANRLIKELE
jgi:replication factor A1